MLNQDIIREATRLTRAGQLVEATALLQRMLRGETAPDATSAPPVASLLPDASRPSLTRRPMLSRRRIVSASERGPHPLNRACSARYSIAKRGAPGSDCEA